MPKGRARQGLRRVFGSCFHSGKSKGGGEATPLPTRRSSRAGKFSPSSSRLSAQSLDSFHDATSQLGEAAPLEGEADSPTSSRWDIPGLSLLWRRSSLESQRGSAESQPEVELLGGEDPSVPRAAFGGSDDGSSPRGLLGRKPTAGKSFMRRKASLAATEGIECWEEADSGAFRVRGPDYLATRAKVLSGPALYRLIGCDIYSFRAKIGHIARHLALPELPPLGPGAAALPPGEQIPPLLIINIQLPSYGPSLFGKQDGPGHSLVYYFALPAGWEPGQGGASATALRLWQRFVQDGLEPDGRPTRESLKLIVRCANVEDWAREASLSGLEQRMVSSYNEKPLLTRPQHSFFQGEGYLEIDLDVHQWAFVARKALQAYIPKLRSVVFETAFVVQGNTEEELPEQLLAAARVARVDLTRVRPFPARLAHTASGQSRLLRRLTTQGRTRPGTIAEGKVVEANAASPPGGAGGQPPTPRGPGQGGSTPGRAGREPPTPPPPQ